MKKFNFLLLFLMTGCAAFHNAPPNRCELDATNMQNIVDARNYLNPNFHNRIFCVRFINNGEEVGHAYCLWRARGQYYAYDMNGTHHLFLMSDGKFTPMWFATQLKRNVVNAYFEGSNGPDQDFEN